MGGKASSNSQSFESFVFENQNDFFDELLHDKIKHETEKIDQSIIRSLKNLKYLIISTENLETAQHVWNKIDFSICIISLTNNPIPNNQYIKCTYKTYSFGVIHIDPVACYHVIFFLNKSKVFLSTQEFLDRIALLSQSSQNELPELVKERKSKPLSQPILNLDVSNPFLEPILTEEFLQSSSCQSFQNFQSDFSSDSDHLQNKNSTNQSTPSLNQPALDKNDNIQSANSIISLEEEEKRKIVKHHNATHKSRIKNRENISNENKSNKKVINSKKEDNHRHPKKQITLQLDEYDYEQEEEKINIKRRSKKRHHTKKSRKTDFIEKEAPARIKKIEEDDLSNLFDFSMTESLKSPSTLNVNQSTDICIDFCDQSSVNNLAQIKNWIPKSEKEESNKNNKQSKSILKNDKKQNSSSKQANKSVNKNVHINLNSDFDKSIRLNQQKGKRSSSSQRRRMKKKANKSNISSKGSLGALTSEFEMNSAISKKGSTMTFKHNFASSEEDYSSENNANISTFLNTSNNRNVNSLIIESPSKKVNKKDFNISSMINGSKFQTRKRNKKKINKNRDNNNGNAINNFNDNKITNINNNITKDVNKPNNEVRESLNTSNFDKEDGSHSPIQVLRIPRIFEKRQKERNLNNSNLSDIKLEQLTSDFDFSASSALKDKKVNQTQIYNQSQNTQNEFNLSNKALGQLTSDFDISTSSIKRKEDKNKSNSTIINTSTNRSFITNNEDIEQLNSDFDDSATYNKINGIHNHDQSKNDFNSNDISWRSNRRNETKRKTRNLNTNISQRKRTMKNHPKVIKNEDLGQLTSDFENSTISNIRNENNISQFQSELSSQTSGRFNSKLDERLNQNKRSEIIKNQQKEQNTRNNKNKLNDDNNTSNDDDKNKKTKRISKASTRKTHLNKTISSSFDLGHLSSDFSSNI